MTVRPYLTALRVIKTGKQIHQGGLAAAGGADNRDKLPGRHGQRHVLQHRLVRGAVGKAQVADFDLPRQPGDGNLAFVRLRVLVDKCKHALTRGQALLQVLINARQAPQGGSTASATRQKRS